MDMTRKPSPRVKQVWVKNDETIVTHTCLTRGDGLRVMSMLAILLSIPCIRLSNPS
jgi:hypothetical protein